MNASSDKSCCWSITINNPTADDIQQWSAMKTLHWVREVSGQVEKGQEGTPHIQGMLKTQSVRFAQVKRALPRAHIEIAKSQTALAKYVVKEDTRVSSIPTTKVATQLDIQRWCCIQVMVDCQKWEAKSRGTDSLDPSDYDDQDIILKYSDAIRKHWEVYVDDAVRSLIQQGYFGVEYVMANAQVRNAFRKYLPEICYRYYGYSLNPPSSPPPLQPQDQEGPLGP